MLINKSYQQNYVYKTLLLLISDVILELNMLITVNKILFLQKVKWKNGQFGNYEKRIHTKIQW